MAMLKIISAKRLAWGSLGLLGILLIGLLFLPVWIASEQGRIYVLQQINAKLTGASAKLDVEDWSFGWFHGTQLNNVTISLPDGMRLLSCPRIESDLTLWGIVWGNFDVGNTRVETAQIRIIKYADGSTSLDSLGGFKKILRTLRGSLQIGSAALILNSQAAGQSLAYSDLKADITIASAKAPFHVQVTAVGVAGQMLSYNATLPALAQWPTSPPMAVLADTELVATRLPTALVCDFLNLDPRWSVSLGESLGHLRWTCREAGPLDASYPVLDVRGMDGAKMDCRFVLQRNVLLLPPESACRAIVSLRPSSPVVELLRRVNPVFASLEKSEGSGLMTLTLSDLMFPLDRPFDVQAVARLSFAQELTFTNTGLLADLLKISNPIIITADPLRFRIADGMIVYDHFILNSDRRRISFRGSVSLDGDCNLMVTVPSPGSLSASTAEILITGRFDNPQVRLPGP
ncbi:MAG: hypothetical protein FWD53_11280 [Phycisphaerales bacterium]|nr:hypothetical protein [Phycisphaerales bacterium]